MAGLLFSIIISVSLVTVMVFAARRQIVRRYGFRVLYILSFILALRLIIPYSVQIPNVPRLNIVIPRWVFAVWIIGAVFSILYHTANYFYSRRRIMRYGKTCSDKDILSLLKEEKRKLYIDSDIPLVISKEVGSPMLVGMLSPVIVSPSAPYTHDEYRMIFRHELLHYRNKDSVKKLFFMFVVSVCWFNPFAYLLMRESSNNLECICDEGVLKNADIKLKKDYCLMLLKTGVGSRFIPMTSNLNTREMLEMRINSIFEKKNKHSGGMLIVSVILCLSILSSILCSCTVDTPQDVIEEMERVESSIENEKEAETKDVNLELRPFSEVVATAQQTLDEWDVKDGVFKFDNCRVHLPINDEFKIYTYNYHVGVEPAQEKVELLSKLEEEFFEEGYFSEDEKYYKPMVESHIAEDRNYYDAEYTLEEFLSSDGQIFSIGASAPGARWKGAVEISNGMISMYSPYWKEQRDLFYENTDAMEIYRLYGMGRTVNCSDAQALQETVTLIDGSNIKLADAVTFAENIINSSEHVIDDKIGFRPDYVYLEARANDTCIVTVNFRAYYDGIAFVDIATQAEGYEYLEQYDVDVNFSNISKFSSVTICGEGNMDSLRLTLPYTEFVSTGEQIEEILSVEQVLNILKDKFSNKTVYNVTEFSLGNAFVSYEDEAWYTALGYKNIPVYEITLKLTGITIYIWIDARTGDMNYYKEIG